MQIEYQQQLTARRSRTTKKPINKRLVTVIIAIFVLLGSTQTYAAVALDTTIIDLIKNGIKLLEASRIADANSQSPAIETDYKAQLQQSVTATKNSAASTLTQYTESELSRARQELTAYLNEKKQQMDSAVAPQVEQSKQEITKNVNAIIALIKQRLDEEFQRQLTDVWKQ